MGVDSNVLFLSGEGITFNPHCSFFCKIIKKSVDNSCFYQQLQSAENVLLRLSAITL